MREHIRKMIDQARMPQETQGIDGRQETPLRLASETIRLARLATSVHMTLVARREADVEAAGVVGGTGDRP